jgi:hypothetical protein
VRREVLVNILIEFGIPMKLVRLIKMCLNETYSKGYSRSKRRENEVHVGVSGPECRPNSGNKNWKQII